VQVLNIPVERLPGKYALGYVGVISIVRCSPKPIVKDGDYGGTDEENQDQTRGRG
jgi:hypothetical protein